MLETAATDPYTQCGFRKVVCLSHFDEFMVSHLPNKYIGSTLGLDASEFCRQVEALLDPRVQSVAGEFLLEPHTKVFHSEWSKNYYEPCRHDLIAMLPAGVRSVLSIGCGWGETEGKLLRKGIDVTAIPMDPVIAACAESRGVKVVYGGLEGAMEQLSGQRFDGVLMSGVLHLLPEPAKALGYASSLLADGGVLVATIPTFLRLPFLWLWLRHPSRYEGWRNFRRSGVHSISRRQAREMLHNAGILLERISTNVPQRWQRLVTLTRGLASAFLSLEYTLVGSRVESSAKAVYDSAIAKPPNIAPTASALQVEVKSDESFHRNSGV